jgi:hypothetical protein
MANTFKLKTASDISSTGETVYTVPDSTTTVIIGLLISNTNTSDNLRKVSAQIVKSGGDDAYIVKEAPMPIGASLETMSGNKIVLETGDAIKIIGSAVTTDFDASLSIMEMT